ncbi:hypothetical protein OG455_09850 [Kitasatospora sp. NBC_01287]|uniref:MinD/ParA family ATP-binding protein n=1 Tax=Kitasatospora sp. NBC_01287 TaxID=2903573 RepID=UPI00225599C2|nr:hypothetical protein [Kitasatospora sp. NBC_01287]MCX4745823.1 hypothetical protein [Kitasatospora sp. NBC_01287]
MTVLVDSFAGTAAPLGRASGVLGALRPGPDEEPFGAPDYTPLSWPAPVPLLDRTPLDPLGTVLIPPTERVLPLLRTGEAPAEPGLPMPGLPLPGLPLPGLPLPGAALPGLPVPGVPPHLELPPYVQLPPGAPVPGAVAPPTDPPSLAAPVAAPIATPIAAPVAAPGRVVPFPDRGLGHAAALELNSERLLRRPAPRGPRALRLPFAGSQEEQRRLLERIRTPLAGCHRITVLGHAAQTGPSAATLALGTLLATHRPDRVIALDLAVPGPGGPGGPGGPDGGGGQAVALGHRVRREHTRTLAELLAVLPALGTYQDVRRFTSRAASGLEVLAELPGAPSHGFDEHGYRQVLATLSSQYPVILSDAGTAADGVRRAAVELADQLVVCASASVAGARGATALLDQLVAQGHGELVRDSVTVVATGPGQLAEGDRPLPAQELAAHFRTRCRGAVLLPADGHLAAADELDLARLRPKARQACLELAALVGESMAHQHPGGTGTWHPTGW